MQGKEILDKNIIDFVREKETISRLFTLESTLTAIYEKICKCDDIAEIKDFVGGRLDVVVEGKLRYANYVLDHPNVSVCQCLNFIQDVHV